MQLLRDNLTLWTSDMQGACVGACALVFLILRSFSSPRFRAASALVWRCLFGPGMMDFCTVQTKRMRAARKVKQCAILNSIAHNPRVSSTAGDEGKDDKEGDA